MKKRKLVYSSIALSKRKAIKKDIKSKYGKIIASAEQSTFMPGGACEAGMSVYYYTDEVVLVLEIFNEREDFMYQMFGIVTTSQDTIDFWGED